MMIDLGIKVKVPDLKLDISTNDKKFWKNVGIEATKEIQKQTLAGKDSQGKPFKPYTKDYKNQRTKAGRSAKPNLTWSGKMLSSMAKGVQPIRNGVKITMSGNEGFKAWSNEQKGRKFFDLTDKNIKSIIKRVTDWVTRKNDLK